MNLQHLPLLLQITEAALEIGRKGCGGGGVGAALLTSGRINHQIIYLRALFGKRVRAIDLQLVWASRTSQRHQQQIVIGIPFMSHQVESDDTGYRIRLDMRWGARSGTGVQKHSRFYILEKKKRLVFVHLNIKRRRESKTFFDCSEKQKPSHRFAGRCVMINY